MISKYIDSLIDKSTPEKPFWNQELIRQNKTSHWNYIDGCMMTAFLTLYNDGHDQKYLNFVKKFIDHFVNDKGDIRTFNKEDYNLDNINEGRALFKLYDYTGDTKYKLALDNIYSQILQQPRTREGNFWHKLIYPNQVWLDGLYMSLPFYLEYDKRFNNKQNYEDIFKQIRHVYNIMRDKETGLYYHGYDSERTTNWCNKTTGLSSNFWLRALGWFYMALVDILEILDSDDTEYREFIITIFKDLTDSVLKYQDQSGMWYQIIDKGFVSGNYLETSGSAILSYGILKAVKLAILHKDYKIYGLKAFYGICNRY
ncbi:MAG: glycoside hydrolase family 88 protein, partial [Spirochaetales bacterium]|nr:glycoside hydrolase family 88 protein [Spirochaetales bacterium]